MRDDSGYKSLETQQSLGKTGVGAVSASLLARIGTRSIDRAAPWLVSQQPVAAVGRTQYSLEAPSVPVKFAVNTSELKDIVVPVPQLAVVQDVKTTTYHVDEPTIPKKTPSHNTLTDFFAGRSFGSGQSTSEDPTQRKQHIPFVPEAAFLEKFAERTQTVGRALTSSFDRIRQQAGSFLSKTTAVVRGSSDVETPASHPGSSTYRRASSSECQSSWTEKDSRLATIPDPYYRRSNSGEVFTGNVQSQSTRTGSQEYTQVGACGQSLHPWTVASASRASSFSEPPRVEPAFTSFATAVDSRFARQEAAFTPSATSAMTAQSARFEARDTGKEIPTGSHQLATIDTGRGSTHRPKPVSPSITQAGSSTHHTRTHAKLPHCVVSESAASSPDFRRGNNKTASKRRREYRSKKQVQEVHHSGTNMSQSTHKPT